MFRGSTSGISVSALPSPCPETAMVMVLPRHVSASQLADARQATSQTCARRASAAAAGSSAPAIERDAVRSPRRARRRTPGPALGAPSLGAHAGQQEDGVRHQLAQPLDVLRLGRADDRAEPESPALAAPAGGAERRDELGEALVERGAVRAAGRADRRRQGWTCGPERTIPAPAAPAASTRGSSASPPSSPLTVDGVGAEALDVAPRGRGRRRRAPAHRRRRDRHVAALAVGDHQQTRHRGRRRRLARAPPSPGAPSRSKHASCGFAATHAGPARRARARTSAATASPARSAGARPRRRRTPRRRPPGQGRGRRRPGSGAPRRAPRAGPRNRGGVSRP